MDQTQRLLELFDADLIAEAGRMNLDGVMFGEIGMARRAESVLENLASRPARQQAYAASLERRIALLLCRWLLDPRSIRGLHKRLG